MPYSDCFYLLHRPFCLRDIPSIFLCSQQRLSEPASPDQAISAGMKYLRLFGYAAQTTESLALPSACLTTTVIGNLPSTSINNATLTYRGPLTNDFLSPFALTTTTYTTTLTTRGADGTTETQTYTVLGAPVELNRSSSLPSPSPTPTGVISAGETGVSTSSSVTVSITNSQPISTSSGPPQSSGQPDVRRLLEFTPSHGFHTRMPSNLYSSPHTDFRVLRSRLRRMLSIANFAEDFIDLHTSQ